MRENNLNRETINRKRKETEEGMKKEGAKKIRNRNEKGQFSGGSRLEATPEQIQKARKEMMEDLDPVKVKLEEISNRIKELEEKYKKSNMNKGVEGSKEDIEKEMDKQERRLREVEEIKNLSKEEKENLLNEIEERFGEKPKKTKKELKKQKEDLKKDIDKWYDQDEYASGDKHKNLEEKMVKAEEKIKDIEKKENKLEEEKEDNKLKNHLEVGYERADKIIEGEDKEENLQEKIDKVAEKIVNDKVLNNEEMKIQQENRKEVRKKVNELYNEEAENDKTEKGKEEEETEENEEENEEKDTEEETEENEEKDTEEETLDLEKELPEDLVELLEQSTLDEENKSLLKKAAIKTRNLTATIGSAIGFRVLAGKIPGLSKIISAGSLGAGVGGAIGGVGYRLARYGIEAWEEKKDYEGFKENFEKEINLEEIDSKEKIKDKMADMETNISVISEKIKQLDNENDELKEQEVWFFQKERREKRKEIQRHRKALEKMRDEFRYLSVEAKKKFENADVESLAESLIEKKEKQLESIINSGGPHGELIKDLLANTEKTSGVQISYLTEKIKGADTGLRAKLKQQGRSVPKEILYSAGLFGAAGVASHYILKIPAVQNQLDKLGNWFSQIDIDMPDFLEGNEELTPEQTKEFKGLIFGLEEESEKATLEFVDKVTETQVNYPVEMGDNVWSVTEEFLSNNLGENFASLGEAEQTYVIDYITTAIENDPASFGLDLANEESINHLLASSEHSISFEPILQNGELTTAIEKAGDLTTEEITNILENNEILRKLISENQDLRLTPETIQNALESGEITEESLSLLTQEGSPLVNIGEGVTEIPYSGGELTMHLEGNSVSFSLDGAEFAEGTINKQGNYYISIENSKQIDLNYTKAYNSARIHLNELLDGESQIVIEGLQGEAVSSGEQIANMENWIERMHKGELNEAHFDFMAGNQKEQWIQQLADIEGVNPAEMEEMINQSYQEISGETTGEIIGAQEAASELGGDVKNPVIGWVERLEENLEKVKEGNLAPEEFREILKNKPENGGVYGDGYMYDALTESYEEKLSEITNKPVGEAISSIEGTKSSAFEGTYTLEGTIDVMDRLDFYDNFTSSFGIEAETTTDILKSILTEDVTPEEFVDWLESDAFGKEIIFDGNENPPRRIMEQKLWSIINQFKRASEENGLIKSIMLRSARQAGRMRIDQFMLYGK